MNQEPLDLLEKQVPQVRQDRLEQQVLLAQRVHLEYLVRLVLQVQRAQQVLQA